MPLNLYDLSVVWESCAPETAALVCRYDDGLLEVMALYSSFHIAQIQVGLASPILLGQARHVKVRLSLWGIVCLMHTVVLFVLILFWTHIAVVLII